MTFRFEDTRPEVETEDLLADIRRVAADMKVELLTVRQYRQHGQFASATAKKRFGSWNRALLAAGLSVGFPKNLPDEELLDNLREVWIALGRQPRRAEMAGPPSRFTHNPYVRRFGSWLAAMRAFAESEAPVGAEEGPSAKAAVPLVERAARQPSLRLRFLVMRRDRFRCVSCGRAPATEPGLVLHVDHTIPFSKGGKTEFENLRTLCSDCNHGKSDLDL